MAAPHATGAAAVGSAARGRQRPARLAGRAGRHRSPATSCSRVGGTRRDAGGRRDGGRPAARRRRAPRCSVAVRRGRRPATVRLTRATFSHRRRRGRAPARRHLPDRRSRAFTRGVGREVRARRWRPTSQRGPAASCSTCATTRAACSTEAVEVASVFLDGGPVVSYERRGARPRTLDAFEGGDPTTPLVVLVEPRTASAAEVVAARAAGPQPRRGRRLPHLRQGLGAGAVPALRRLGARADRRPLPHAVRPQPRRRRHRARRPGAAAAPRPRSPSGARSRCSPGWWPLSAARAGAEMPKEQGRKLIAQNRKARHDYHIDDVFEAGLVLDRHRGQVAAGGARLAGRRLRAHPRRRGVAGRRAHPGVHRGHLDQPRAAARTQAAAAPRARSSGSSARPRRAGTTLVPLSLYFKDGKAKVEIALGPRQEDLRQAAGAGRAAVASARCSARCPDAQRQGLSDDECASQVGRTRALLRRRGVAAAARRAAPARRGRHRRGAHHVVRRGADRATTTARWRARETIAYDFGTQPASTASSGRSPTRCPTTTSNFRVYRRRATSGSTARPVRRPTCRAARAAADHACAIGDPDKTVTGRHTTCSATRSTVRSTASPTTSSSTGTRSATSGRCPIERRHRARGDAAGADPGRPASRGRPAAASRVRRHARDRHRGRPRRQPGGLSPTAPSPSSSGCPRGAVTATGPILEERWTLRQSLTPTPLTGSLPGCCCCSGVGRRAAWLVGVRGRDRRFAGQTPGLVPAVRAASDEPVPLVGAGPVAVQFQPPEGLRPGQIGTLLDERANVVDVTATIVDLAVRGHLRIVELERAHWFSSRDWRLEKLTRWHRRAAAVRAGALQRTVPVRRPGAALVVEEDLRGPDGEGADGALRGRDAGRLVPRPPGQGPQRLADRRASSSRWPAAGSPGSLSRHSCTGRRSAWRCWLVGVVALPLRRRMPARTAARARRCSPQAQGFPRVHPHRRGRAAAVRGGRRTSSAATCPTRSCSARRIAGCGCSARWPRPSSVGSRRRAGTPGRHGWDMSHFGQSLDGFTSTAASTLAASTPSSSGGSGFGGGGSSGGGGGGGGGGSW